MLQSIFKDAYKAVTVVSDMYALAVRQTSPPFALVTFVLFLLFYCFY